MNVFMIKKKTGMKNVKYVNMFVVDGYNYFCFNDK